MGPHRLHAAAAALLIVVVCALVAASPTLDGLRGLSIDALTALRWRVFGNKPAPSAAVVVALDEETFRTPPFEGTPSVTWTREAAQKDQREDKNWTGNSSAKGHRTPFKCLQFCTM